MSRYNKFRRIFETVKLNHLMLYPSITRETKPRKPVSEYYVCCCFFQTVKPSYLNRYQSVKCFRCILQHSETKPQKRYQSITCVVAFFRLWNQATYTGTRVSSVFVVFYRQWRQAAQTTEGAWPEESQKASSGGAGSSQCLLRADFLLHLRYLRLFCVLRQPRSEGIPDETTPGQPAVFCQRWRAISLWIRELLISLSSFSGWEGKKCSLIYILLGTGILHSFPAFCHYCFYNWLNSQLIHWLVICFVKCLTD